MLHLAVAWKGLLWIVGELLHPVAQLRRVNVQVLRRLPVGGSVTSKAIPHLTGCFVVEVVAIEVRSERHGKLHSGLQRFDG